MTDLVGVVDGKVEIETVFIPFACTGADCELQWCSSCYFARYYAPVDAIMWCNCNWLIIHIKH